MPVVEHAIEIRGSPEEVFDLSQDYDLRLRWDPFLRSLKFIGGATQPALGVRTRVRAWNGLAMTVEFVAFDRPRTVAMAMIDGPHIFRMFAGSWRFRASAPGQTLAVFRYTFHTRPARLAWLVEPIVKRVLARDVRARLRGLKRGIEDRGLRSGR